MSDIEWAVECVQDGSWIEINRSDCRQVIDDHIEDLISDGIRTIDVRLIKITREVVEVDR